MDEIISALLKLIGLSNKAFRQGKAQMGADFLNSALELSETHDVNVNKLIQEKRIKDEKQKHDLDGNPKRDA